MDHGDQYNPHSLKRVFCPNDNNTNVTEKFKQTIEILKKTYSTEAVLKP